MFVLCSIRQNAVQGSCGSLKVLESPWIFSRFSRPGKSLKTDMVLESPWICFWRSLNVPELDFLKRHDRTSIRRLLRPWNMPRMRCRPGLWPRPHWGSSRCSSDPLVGWGGGHPSQKPHPLVSLGAFGSSILTPLLIYPLYGPWKSLNLILTNGQES